MVRNSSIIIINDNVNLDTIIHADDERLVVEPACGATLAAVYSGLVKRLQASGQLPAAITSALVIVCGGAVVTLDLLQQWKQQFAL